MQVINPSPSAVYTGISNAFTTITRVEGARSLWRGVSSVILGAGEWSGKTSRGIFTDGYTGPAHAVYFATYEAVKNAMGGNDKSQHHPLAAGLCLVPILEIRHSDYVQQPAEPAQQLLAMLS